ncbi:hypothetical protein QBC39DRAFT_297808 [Podospora conica]|nr:hypothetical protein QBC39DRAFT_297808 [Schizothecium conicum]
MVPTLQYPSPHQEDTRRQRCLIVFIPGNPGLIGYYDPFLSTLRELLDEAESCKGSTKSFHIYGQNLLGFSDADHNPPFSSAAPPFTLEDQINHFSARLTEISTLRLASGATVPFDHILVMGHSVGAYIAVEVFHRHHLRLAQPPSPPATTPALNLKTGILLFPAISHIARSPNGQILDRLRASPFLNQWAHHVGRALVTPIPRVCLEWICRNVLRQSHHASVATTDFLASRDGIWQALHLGKDEMVSITEDRWSEDLWEHQGPLEGSEGDKFFFYFGTGDRWVDDVSRDEFIAARRKASGAGAVKVVMDEGGIPHAFCIHHSEEVASKVMGWIEEATR